MCPNCIRGLVYPKMEVCELCQGTALLAPESLPVNEKTMDEETVVTPEAEAPVATPEAPADVEQPAEVVAEPVAEGETVEATADVPAEEPAA